MYCLKHTLATVSHIKATGQYITGLVTELVSQPGVGTALIAVGCPRYAS